ncbi:MAG: phospholipase [Thermosipho sp. (in: Bacteria)]|nr:phospholipase [Thermosipho sp. (in: thermotogales)]
MRISSLVLIIIIQLTFLGFQVYFTENQTLTDTVVEFINNSKTFLYISSYSLNHAQIISEINKLGECGVDVKILLEVPNPQLGRKVKIDYEKSLHHAKFMVNDSGVLFGSSNFTESGLETGFNDLIIFDTFVEQFRNLFLNLWYYGRIVGCSPFLVVGYDEVETEILKLLSKSKNRIYVSVYAFTNEKIFTLLKYKEAKGVDVRIITDSWFKISKLKPYPVRNFKIIYDPMLHHKFIIVDDKVILGSANYTVNGLTKNFEMVYITEEFLDEYLNVFNFLWRYSSEDKNN